MKHLNRLVIALICLLLCVNFAHADTAGDLNTIGRASFISRDGYKLYLGSESTDGIEFIINDVKVLGIGGTGISTFSLANDTYLKAYNAAGSALINVLKVDSTDDTVLNADSGDVIKFDINGVTEATLSNDTLTFSDFNIGDINTATGLGIGVGVTRELTITNDQVTFTGAASELVPGVTSFSVRNNADSADNLIILDAGTATLRGSLVLTSTNSVRLAPYVPTMAATPVVGTNQLLPGLNIIPTAAANTAAILGASTPVPGEQFRIVNSGPNAVFIKAGGGATMNGAQAGGKIALATLASINCVTTSATNYNCEQPVVPTPQAP